MRARVLTVLLGSLALAQAACAGPPAGAAAYTCGHMRDTLGTFREQAGVLVDREALRPSRLSREEAVLDAEFRIRRACDGAADGTRPYDRAAALPTRGWFSPGSAH